MLLLLRECQEKEFFFYHPNVLKNVEALMTYKKKCSNTLKFGLYNIPRPLLQVNFLLLLHFSNLINYKILTILGCFNRGLQSRCNYNIRPRSQ